MNVLYKWTVNKVINTCVLHMNINIIIVTLVSYLFQIHSGAGRYLAWQIHILWNHKIQEKTQILGTVAI